MSAIREAVLSATSLEVAWPALGEARLARDAGAPRLVLEGLWGAGKALAVSALLGDSPAPTIFLVPTTREIELFAQDLRSFYAALGGDPSRAIAFMPPQALLWRGGRQRESEAERASILWRLLRGGGAWVVTTPEGATAPLPSPAAFRAAVIDLSPGTPCPRDALVEQVVAAGYERVETVVEIGQVSVRGGLVDVFSPAGASPVRIEYFGDEIESLREFDPTSQRSTRSLTQAAVLPLLEGDEGVSLFDYLPSRSPAVVTDPAILDGAARGDHGAPVDLATFLEGRQQISLGLLVTAGGDEPRIRLETRSVENFRGQFRKLAAQLQEWLEEGYRVRLFTPEPDRLREIFRGHDLWAEVAEHLTGPERLAILSGDCSAGFECPALGLIVLGDGELFGVRRHILRRPTYKRGAGLASFAELQVGDLVVHADHGIGRYVGLVTLKVEGRDGDYLLLEYAEGNRLYLPVQRLAAVSKYVGGDSTARLDRLGGSAWQRVKESVRRSLRDVAKDLLQLYADRTVVEGHGFSPDTPWQAEFEAAFPFEETEDQREAITTVKAEMEQPRPMDRLVCGDVGYGKTEVAMRAAFKAATDGKQVAVLVPTTILAQQHWGTFRERFVPYPLKVEMLSRFRTAREQTKILAGLKTGGVDVVIGTHRLLEKDVAFKDLGLLIVDEEHRFGVAHKERLKRLRKSVDVLTLTATPIPRTLSMALSGIRDLSVIDTPPPDRRAIETVVARFDRRLIREAIEHEVSRGGQVFFVHNRIQSLPSMVRFLGSLVPQARLAMAHGRMRERELESVMLRFVAGEYDVLVSTAIVESGLDIPACNTIVINRADRFGLAQLYQLRGRVGRDRLQAYAYLLIPADGGLDTTAQKRLRVIQELTELGSGFKIAIRDLEIRGAGNLLGAEQHGQIAAVGFDLYCQLLEQAVRELRGEEITEDVDPIVTIEAEAFIPEEYVGDVHERLSLYKRLAALRHAAECEEVRAELLDRFGPLPSPVRQLLEVVELRVVARHLGIEKLEAIGQKVLITFAPSTPVPPERLLVLIRQERGRIRLVRDFLLEAPLPGGGWGAVHGALRELLERLT